MGGKADVDERLRRLSGLGDHLEAFAAVDFEMSGTISSRPSDMRQISITTIPA